MKLRDTLHPSFGDVVALYGVNEFITEQKLAHVKPALHHYNHH